MQVGVTPSGRYANLQIPTTINPDQMDSHILTGQWICRDGKIVGDDACEEIERLVREDLEKVGHDASGWDTLYRNIESGTLWVLSYPEGEVQGGGPPQLALVAPKEARLRFKFNVDSV